MKEAANTGRSAGRRAAFDRGAATPASAAGRAIEAAPRGGIDEPRLVAQLSRDLDRAIHLRLAGEGARAADRAEPLVHRHARLAARVARFHLAFQRPQAALDAIDACRHHTDALRLLRIACLLQSGAPAEAHLDLHRWSARPDAPGDARLWLAHLEWTLGGPRAAMRCLQRNLRDGEDAASLALLALLARLWGDRESARRWSHRLRDVAALGGASGTLRVLIDSLGLAPRRVQDLPQGCAQTLAMELAAAPELIPALAAAQRRRPHPIDARLLCRAIELALPELEDQASALEALARVCLGLDDPGRALGWARRLVRCEPLSAGAAILVRECQAAVEIQARVLAAAPPPQRPSERGVAA
jgi:hypothetical protein